MEMETRSGLPDESHEIHGQSPITPPTPIANTKPKTLSPRPASNPHPPLRLHPPRRSHSTHSNPRFMGQQQHPPYLDLNQSDRYTLIPHTHNIQFPPLDSLRLGKRNNMGSSERPPCGARRSYGSTFRHADLSYPDPVVFRRMWGF